jgi:hypothetical protein
MPTNVFPAEDAPVYLAREKMRQAKAEAAPPHAWRFLGG